MSRKFSQMTIQVDPRGKTISLWSFSKMKGNYNW